MASAKLGFRPDIQGLRAIAVLMVVLYHAKLFGLSGGFIGVDVFFVLSGYLITALLVDEAHRNGRISLPVFWARRIRRLLPASWLVIVASVVAAYLLLWPLERASFWRDGVAASAYVINLWLGVIGTDYLDGGDPSLFQHYWSLAVEEQFYLIWPIIVTLLVARRHLVRFVVPGLIAVSFLLCLYFTAAEQPIAFFMPFTRAWEFLAGAALAWATRGRGLSLPRSAINTIALASMVTLVGSAVLVAATTTFPGATSLLPVLATCGLLASKGGIFFRPLSTGPAQYLGNISYSLYLWHWPILFIARAKLGDDLSPWVALALVAVSVVLADGTYRFVETPLRSPSAAVIGERPYAVAVVGTVAVALVASSLMLVPSLRSGPSSVEAQQMEHTVVPSDITPALSAASSSNPETYDNGCHLGITEDAPVLDCVYGDPRGAPRVALVGDSHAAHWLPGIDQAAKSSGIAVYNFTKSGCPAADVTIWSSALRRDYRECDEWRQSVISAVHDLGITQVIASDYRDYRLSGGEPLGDWASALMRTASQIGDASVVAVSPTPTFPFRPAYCLSGNLDNAPACGIGRDEAVRPGLIESERQVLADAGIQYIDASEWLCSDSFCPVVDGKMLIYRDSHHIAVPFSTSLAPLWGPVLTGAG